MRRVMNATLHAATASAWFALSSPATAQDALTITDVMVDFRSLLGQRVGVVCSVVPVSAELVYCMDGRLGRVTHLLIDPSSASRDDRKRLFQGCDEPYEDGGCLAIVEGVLTDWHGVPRLESPTVSPLLE